MQSHNNLHGCNLRTWITYHLDSSTFPGVEWLDDQEAEYHTFFKIPWNKNVHAVDLERENQIFLVSANCQCTKGGQAILIFWILYSTIASTHSFSDAKYLSIYWCESLR